MPDLKNKIVDLGHSKIFIRNDGIAQVDATDCVFTVNDIKLINTSICELTKSQKNLFLLIASGFTELDSEARKFISTPEASQHSVAKAFVIKSLAQRIIMNFIVNVKGTYVPTKFFTNTEIAVKWLKHF